MPEHQPPTLEELELQLQASENEKREMLADFKKYHEITAMFGEMANGNIMSLPRVVAKLMANPAKFQEIGETIEKIVNKYNFNNE